MDSEPPPMMNNDNDSSGDELFGGAKTATVAPPSTAAAAGGVTESSGYATDNVHRSVLFSGKFAAGKGGSIVMLFGFIRNGNCAQFANEHTLLESAI